MRAIPFDLDGVLYQGSRVIDGAVETLRWCERNAVPHLFVTNTSSKPRRALVERLSGLGLAISAEQIFAPPVAAHDYLTARKAEPVALFVRDATREDFGGLTLLGDAAMAANADFKGLAAAHGAFLAAYRAGNWATALKHLRDARDRGGPALEGLYDVFEIRVAGFRANPPPRDWDGVFEAETK